MPLTPRDIAMFMPKLVSRGGGGGGGGSAGTLLAKQRFAAQKEQAAAKGARAQQALDIQEAQSGRAQQRAVLENKAAKAKAFLDIAQAGAGGRGGLAAFLAQNMGAKIAPRTDEVLTDRAIPSVDLGPSQLGVRQDGTGLGIEALARPGVLSQLRPEGAVQTENVHGPLGGRIMDITQDGEGRGSFEEDRMPLEEQQKIEALRDAISLLPGGGSIASSIGSVPMGEKVFMELLKQRGKQPGPPGPGDDEALDLTDKRLFVDSTRKGIREELKNNKYYEARDVYFGAIKGEQMLAKPSSMNISAVSFAMARSFNGAGVLTEQDRAAVFEFLPLRNRIEDMLSKNFKGTLGRGTINEMRRFFDLSKTVYKNQMTLRSESARKSAMSAKSIYGSDWADKTTDSILQSMLKEPSTSESSNTPPEAKPLIGAEGLLRIP